MNTNIGASFACKTRFDRVFFLSTGVTDAKGHGGLLAKPKQKLEQGWHPSGIRLLGKDRCLAAYYILLLFVPFCT